MKTDSLGQTLHDSLNNAEAWIRQAEQQYLVAEAISPAIRKRGSTEGGTLLSVGYLKTTTLLLALAVENSFKAIKASRGEFQVDAGGLIKQTRGGGRTGHSLTDLAAEVGFSLSQAQQILLERLTAIGIWAGKYHAPIHHGEFERANASNPRSITLPNDVLMVKEILRAAASISGVSSVVV